MKRILISAITILFALSLQAQTKWYNPMGADFPVIQNRGWNDEIKDSYQRIPDRGKEILRKSVWDLSENSAGLAIHFYTNADKIEVRYVVNGSFAMNHMPATGKSGIDLYAIDSEGNWRVMTDRYSFADTVTFTYTNIIESDRKIGFEYRMFLPLYNTVTWMEIGVPEDACFSFIPESAKKPIIVYGTSIAQGGCASRPAMGWTNILSRKLDMSVINLAFSGNGSLEKEMVDLINELDASLIIYDCLPNMGSLSDNEIKKRTAYGVLAIRKKSNTPILITDHIGLMNSRMNSSTMFVGDNMNALTREVIDSLHAAGVEDLYHLHVDSINFPQDGAVDYIHPNDLGMQAYADAYEKIVRQILRLAYETKVSEDITWKKLQFDNLFDAKQFITVIEVDLNGNVEVDIPFLNEGFKRTSAAAEELKADAAVNGSFFNTKTGGSVVFLRKDGEVINYTGEGFNPYRENAGFMVDKEGKVTIEARPETGGWKSLDAQHLLTSGPLLIKDGALVEQLENPFNDNRHPRTAAGITEDNKLILLVVDGRSSQSYGMSIAELAETMKALGCVDAMNLDGGGSSTAWIKEIGVINHPSDNKQFDNKGERAVGNSIVVIQK